MAPPPAPPGRSTPLPTAIVYLLMLVLAVAAYVWIRSLGLGLKASPAPAGTPLFGAGGAHAHLEALPHILLALVVIIALARAVGRFFAYIHQPPVIGEILAGILLGPSLLGQVAPTVYAFVLPQAVAPFLKVLAQVGVILFMFLVGVELDPSL